MKLKQWFAAFSLLMLAGAGCTTGNQTTDRGMMSTRSAPSAEVDPMREHCKIMPEMPGCEVYAEEGEETQPVTEDRSISGLGDALPQTDVYLRDGESYSLDASFVKKEVQGNVIRMLAYNREIPGPVLHVKQGDTVNVAFTNHLDEPTTVHWHGLRVENAYDGVPDMTQPPVNPGGSFTYRLKFPDAGLYWYHPHIREDYHAWGFPCFFWLFY
jgi:FtsP/CotA-like multicopper oxidase with cupredoxin domain